MASVVAAWPTVELSEVMQQVSRAETVQADKEYRLLGIRLDGHGPFLRETKLGAQSAAGTLFRVSRGDFIYSRLFAWRGAFGAIDNTLDGSYVSSEFPTFRPVPGQIDIEFLRYWFRLPSTLAAVEADCSGSTPLTRNRFKEQFFFQLEIPLPSLAEQRRIVARIEELAARIKEARGLRREATVESERLLVAMAHRADLDSEAKRRAGWQEVAIGEIATFVQDPYRVDTSATYPNFGIYSFGRGLFPKPPIQGISTSADVLYRVRKGQFIYSRLFAFEGAYGMVTDEYDGCFISNEYPTFECDPERAAADFLNAYFKAPQVWSDVAVGSKGLGDRRQRVQPAQVLAHQLWLPPLEWQHQIAYVRARIDEAKQVQAETAAELDALLPSVLDKAFRGEL